MRLAELYCDTGHVYVMGDRYIHLHVYVSDPDLASFVASLLDGKYRTHQRTHDVYVTNRRSLAKAVARLLRVEDELTEKAVGELSFARAYCEAQSPVQREAIVAALQEYQVAAAIVSQSPQLPAP